MRADHDLRKTLRLFFRFSRLRVDYIDAINAADAPYPGQPNGTTAVRSWGYSSGADSTLSSRVVNEFPAWPEWRAQGGLLRPARVSRGPC